MNLKTGHQLAGGRYRVERVLGQGGFGITYLCEQTGLLRKVTIKEFFMKELCNRDSDTSHVSIPSIGSREMVDRFRQKFIKEARAIAAFGFDNKHIVRIIDVFEENNTAYYVMEYVGGGSLSDKVKAGALDETDALRYIRQIASALDFVHGKHMMHLDVKPSNILLNENDEAVLIDFGLAKQYDTQGSQTSTTPVGISHGYAPLEQYRQGGVGTFSPATDIYSLGATLYKLLTGQTPPDAGDVNDDGLPALSPHISAPVRAAIETAMQPRRKDRPQSIDEFLSLLEGNVKAENGKVKVAGKREQSTSSLDALPSDSGLREAKTEPMVATNQSGKPDDGETVIANSSTLGGEVSRSDGGEVPGGCVISSESEKSLESGEKEILHSVQDDKKREPIISSESENLHSAQNDKEQKTVISTERSDGEIFSTDAGETVFNVVIPNVHEESPKKRPFNKRLLTIISVAAICIIAVFFGIKSCNDFMSVEPESSYATFIAEQERLETERLAQEAAEKTELERIEAERKAKEEADRKRKEEYARTHGIINGHEYVDLGLPSGILWATCNVGASKPEEYGGYYAWGETEEKEDYSWSNYKCCNGSDDTMTKYCTNSRFGTVDNKTTLDPEDDVAHVRWGDSWRMPTKAEFQELIDNCTRKWTTQNGVNGYKVTSKKNGNSIFLPAAGSILGARFYSRGDDGDYWSSSLCDDCLVAYNLGFTYGDCSWYKSLRCGSRSVRPVCD